MKKRKKKYVTKSDLDVRATPEFIKLFREQTMFHVRKSQFSIICVGEKGNSHYLSSRTRKRRYFEKENLIERIRK